MLAEVARRREHLGALGEHMLGDVEGEKVTEHAGKYPDGSAEKVTDTAGPFYTVPDEPPAEPFFATTEPPLGEPFPCHGRASRFPPPASYESPDRRAVRQAQRSVQASTPTQSPNPNPTQLDLEPNGPLKPTKNTSPSPKRLDPEPN